MAFPLIPDKKKNKEFHTSDCYGYLNDQIIITNIYPMGNTSSINFLHLHPRVQDALPLRL